MKEKRDRSQMHLGVRMAQLRKEKGLTQSDFCEEFSVFAGLKNQLLVPSVSSWEQDRRLPAIHTIAQIAMFYDVSIEYLLDMTNDRHITKDGNDSNLSLARSLNNDAHLSFFDVPLKNDDYPNYNLQPVYVHFKNHLHNDKWGILNYSKREVVFPDGPESLSLMLECYPVAPLSPFKTQISSLQQLMGTDYIWIEMMSADSDVKALYNGRYTHNESRQCLVKTDTGLMLSYNGLDTAYWAFKG